jgi:hypothetical protein
MNVHVSVTGFSPKGPLSMPAFWWRTLISLAQARKSPGIVAVAARVVGGTYHTMTVWSDEASMQHFVTSGAHRRAMKKLRTLGTGKAYGYVCDHIPDWQSAHRLWCLHAKEV